MSSPVDGGGRVKAMIRKEAHLPSKRTELVAILPEHVRAGADVEFVDGPAAEDYFGGLRVRDDGVIECTSGFIVENASGTRGFTTAGHCGGINEIVEIINGTVRDSDHQGQHQGAWGDVEWHTMVDFPNPSPLFWAGPTNFYRSVTAVEAAGSISVGESVCVWSPGLGSTNCGEVEATSTSCTVSGVSSSRLVRMVQNNLATFLDSGSPWFVSSRAYGATKGSCGGGTVWSKAAHFDEALGIDVVN